MRAHRVHRALACLALTVPALAWAGFGGKSSPLSVLFPIMLVVSAVMLLVLFVGLFVSERSFVKHTYMVGAADLLAAGCMMVSGDGLGEVFASFLGIGGVLLLFIALLVHVGESMMAEGKAKRAASPRARRQAPVRDSD